MPLPELNWPTVISHLTLLGVAYILAVPIGWNREHHSRSAGLRTFPLVAVATGAVGVAVAWQRFEIAIVLSLLTFLTLQFVPAFKTKVKNDEWPDTDDEAEEDD
jgi:uncharacterized membrane protein YhiD involved in acid resistance